jgi:hypothetical protein
MWQKTSDTETYMDTENEDLQSMVLPGKTACQTS